MLDYALTLDPGLKSMRSSINRRSSDYRLRTTDYWEKKTTDYGLLTTDYWGEGRLLATGRRRRLTTDYRPFKATPDKRSTTELVARARDLLITPASFSTTEIKPERHLNVSVTIA